MLIWVLKCWWRFRSCFFGHSEVLQANQLAAALIQHLKSSAAQNSNYGGNIEEDDFPVQLVNEDGVSQLKLQ